MQGTVELNGVRIFYDDAGEGPPVLLVMGLGAPHVGWDGQVEAFRARYRAVAFDNRGCGRSATPPGPYSMKSMADDAIALMTALRIRRAHIVGISMGGMIAQEMALGWPERVGALVLASSYAAPDGTIRSLADNGHRTLRDPFAAMKRIVELTFSDDFIAREGGTIMHMFARGAPNGPNLPGLLAQMAGTLEHDASGRVGAIRAPTLVVTGDGDKFIAPERSADLARAIPGARLEVLTGGTHGVNFEKAGKWNDLVLGFLAEHDALLGAPSGAGAAAGARR